MRTSRTTMVTTIAFALAARAVAEAPTGEDALLASLVGAYRGEGPHQAVAISPRRLGPQRAPVWTDLGTGAIRVLFPGPAGVLVAGAEIARPEPPALTIAPRANGERYELAVTDAATGATWLLVRMPLRRVELEIARGGTKLGGTLHLPAGAGPFPAVLLAGGSESEGDRDSLDGLPYLLAARGVAALAIDKRGTGGSEGTWDVDHPTLAADLAAWLDALAARPEIRGPLGIVGFSEGAWLATFAASLTPRVGFVVAISGGVLPKSESYLHQMRTRLTEEGLSGDALERAFVEKRDFMAAALARATAPTEAKPFDLRMADDPAPRWAAFRGPVLALFGADDPLVPAERSAAALAEMLGKAHHPDFTVRLFRRANHALFETVTGTFAEFQRMSGISRFATGYWETLLGWIEAHVTAG